MQTKDDLVTLMNRVLKERVKNALAKRTPSLTKAATCKITVVGKALKNGKRFGFEGEDTKNGFGWSLDTLSVGDLVIAVPYRRQKDLRRVFYLRKLVAEKDGKSNVTQKLFSGSIALSNGIRLSDINIFARHRPGKEMEGRESKLTNEVYEANKARWEAMAARPKYKSFTIPKKSGGLRTIHAPVDRLKKILSCLADLLQMLYPPHDAAHGFVPGRGVVTNAAKHIGKGYVWNIDLKDFFPSINKRRIRAYLLGTPYDLGSSEERKKLANVIAALCTTPSADDIEELVLPQGAPTSPIITNIVCARLDRRLEHWAKRNNATYTRYADDITFSANHHIFAKKGAFVLRVREIIVADGFTINKKKVRLQQRGHKQEVTGLVVNEKLNVHTRYIKQVRQLLHIWEKEGLDACQRFYEGGSENQDADTNQVRYGNVRNVVQGKLAYLRMVRGPEDGLTTKLQLRLLSLLGIMRSNEAGIDADLAATGTADMPVQKLEDLIDQYLNTDCEIDVDVLLRNLSL